MATVEEVNPEQFIDPEHKEPAFGRGAWNKQGIDFDYRYMRAPKGEPLLGTECEVSLARWAVGAGVKAIQNRLITLKITTVDELGSERLKFGTKTANAVKEFQSQNSDPASGDDLVVDGIVGMSDARALWTSVCNQAEEDKQIPDHLLRGQMNHESLLDPGAVGYYIYYGEELSYRGVDRGMAMINSAANPHITWTETFQPAFSIKWSADRMRSTFDSYNEDYPKRRDAVLWDAAVCAHNSPLWGRQWAQSGAPPNEQAARYVAAVKAAIY